MGEKTGKKTKKGVHSHANIGGLRTIPLYNKGKGNENGLRGRLDFKGIHFDIKVGQSRKRMDL